MVTRFFVIILAGSVALGIAISSVAAWGIANAVVAGQARVGQVGQDGAPGTDGYDGSAGTAGTNGATGATGPAGPRGSTGATGPAGPTGPAGQDGTGGLSAPIVHSSTSGSVTLPMVPNATATLMSFTLPAGAYVDSITSVLTVTNPPAQGYVYCSTTFGVSKDTFNAQPLDLVGTGVHSSTSSSTVSVECAGVSNGVGSPLVTVVTVSWTDLVVISYPVS